MQFTRTGQPISSISLTTQHWPELALLAAGLVTYGGLVSLHLQGGTLRAGQTPYTLAWYGLAFIVYLAALLWAERQRGFSLGLIWAGAIAFRLVLLLTTPTLSDDVYRYLWDGYVANQGVSPYTYPIDSPALDYLDIPQRALANHSWMVSPYLPAAQFLFAGLMAILPRQPLSFQAAMALIDLLVGLLILKLLRPAGLPGYRLLLYLWNPLVVVEVAHGAHVDVWMILLTLLAVWLTLTPGRSAGLATWLAPAALALATLTKILPVLLLPLFFWRWRWRQLALYGALVLLLLLPFGLQAGWGLSGPLDGTGLFGAVRVYAAHWNFNSGLFHWLEVDGLPSLGLGEVDSWARRIVAATLLVSLAVVWLLARRRTESLVTLRLMTVPFAAYLFLTTTVHPWYALALLAFLPFLPPRPGESAWRWLAAAPWLYLSASLPLSYLTYLDPLNFRELEWVHRTEWLPALGLVALWLIVEVIRSIGPRAR